MSAWKRSLPASYVTRPAFVNHVVVTTSRQRTCTRPDWTSSAASESDSFKPLPSRAVVFNGRGLVGLTLLTFDSLTGEPNAVNPYCGAIGTTTVVAPLALIVMVNDPTVVLA